MSSICMQFAACVLCNLIKAQQTKIVCGEGPLRALKLLEHDVECIGNFE